jgi:gas vesicle protein GvpL/GvpF
MGAAIDTNELQGAERATAAYVYGVTRAADARPQSDGVGGAAVHPVEHRDLAALVSDVPSVPVRAKRRDLLRHSDVLQSALTAGTIIPLRFGTVFDDAQQVVDDLLTTRYDELSRLLRELDGLAELSVRATYVEDAVLAELVHEDATVARLRKTSAAAVMLGEAVSHALARKRAAEAAGIVDALKPLARDVAVDDSRTALDLLRASFLVDRSSVGAFDAAMDELARNRAGSVEFAYVGPMPPHSFVRLGGN